MGMGAAAVEGAEDMAAKRVVLMSKLSSEDAIGGELECVASAGLRRAFQW